MEREIERVEVKREGSRKGKRKRSMYYFIMTVCVHKLGCVGVCSVRMANLSGFTLNR